MATVVRPAVPQDERALAALDAVAWPPGTWVVAPGEGPFFDERHPVHDVLVAELDGLPAGYVRVVAGELASMAHVQRVEGLAVDPRHRRRGVARALLAGAVELARNRGARKLSLRVLATNPGAQALYRSVGFVEEGRLRAEFLIDGDAVDDVVMALFL